MEVKNLAQFKRAIQNGNAFRIIRNDRFPEFNGQIRVPSKVQTNGFYSVVKDEPNNKVSQLNDGLGSWLMYGKAINWTFENGTCKLYDFWEVEFV